MHADPYSDPTWDKALNVARKCLTPPSILARLVHNSWTSSISMKEFLYALDTMSFPSAAFIQAAQLLDESISSREPAVTKLGFKGAASVAAVHFACGAIAAKCKAGELRNLILQKLMDSIEIGYHFGLSTTAIGPETGVLIGFAQRIGGALLITDGLPPVADAQSVLNSTLSRHELIHAFGCEPYQVSSLALQRLGFGPEFASAAAFAIGHLNHELVTKDQMVRDWWAASDWISALIAGEERPKRRSSAEHFPELRYSAEASCEIPLHLQALASSIGSVRDSHSHWNWHVAQQQS
jgi:hypothetical protein